jgi:hypothetical protein
MVDHVGEKQERQPLEKRGFDAACGNMPKSRMETVLRQRHMQNKKKRNHTKL